MTKRLTALAITITYLLTFVSCSSQKEETGEGQVRASTTSESVTETDSLANSVEKSLTMKLDSEIKANKNRILLGNFWEGMSKEQFNRVVVKDSIKIARYDSFPDEYRSYSPQKKTTYIYRIEDGKLPLFRMSTSFDENQKLMAVDLALGRSDGMQSCSSGAKSRYTDRLVEMLTKKYGTPHTRQILKRDSYMSGNKRMFKWISGKKQISLNEFPCFDFLASKEETIQAMHLTFYGEAYASYKSKLKENEKKIKSQEELEKKALEKKALESL